MSISISALDFCSEPVSLHCPVCGQLIYAIFDYLPKGQKLISDLPVLG